MKEAVSNWTPPPPPPQMHVSQLRYNQSWTNQSSIVGRSFSPHPQGVHINKPLQKVKYIS